MAMMKNVTEKKGSIRLSLIRFHSTNKIDNYSRGSGEGKKIVQSLTGFLSANKIDNYNRGRKKGK